MAPRCFQLNNADNVATLLDDAAADTVACAGATTGELIALEPIARGHKIALVDLPAGVAVVKFGLRIGHTTRPVARGAWVHLHNLASDLDPRSGTLDPHSGAPSDTAAYE